MTHDPLCPAGGMDTSRVKCWRCVLITKVRADEREQVLAEGPYFTTLVHDCCVELQDIKAARGEAS